MKFSKQFVSILKNFATINSGIYFKAGDFVMTRSASGATYAETVLPPGEEIEFNVAIFDLNAFLSILSLSGEDSEITSSGNEITIKGKRSVITWPAAELDSIVYPKNAIKFPPASVEFELNGEDFKQLMKISHGLGANTLSIGNENGKIVIAAYNKELDPNFSKALSTFEVADYTGDKEFKFIIHLENMKILPADYTVKLWAVGEQYAAKFVGEQASYVISLEDGSTHNF
ncbi:DNA polymerase accessory protein, sliding clamp [Acinetobacter phage vB_AbaM_PhT2]|uniref:Sliding clamp n=2 Tax=Hadassahvirus TaxID=2842716 RepID=A0A6B9SWC0_9CAUD|nr:DNA polymerase sliding clamp [Acinetobacter phage AbTZA1]YP_009887249.1 DNA polymerase accessory protein, sliding clamp [Acinetobacter phage vB_AbaM_PhT2]QQM13837.1 sliding clamp of DNA polymerase [Acinetobacter phage Maestro]QQM18593.1 sliding clamp subunit [Acinetobacter phage Morttis]UQS94176.1 sliding clamp of DNA polymerase [Acinetobacter phage AB-Navy71]SSU39259.1 gp45 sliding clamp, C terminal [Acinetobacter baumannii]AZU98594.1 DNA polymerase sliding clamp [Acinetobacter phage AbTZ